MYTGARPPEPPAPDSRGDVFLPTLWSTGYSAEAGCSGRGVQWMGVVSSNNTSYDIM